MATVLPFLCSWEREDNPTRHMGSEQARKFWRDRDVLYDCEFSLRPGANMPDDLRAAWADLRALVMAHGNKSTTHTRGLVTQLRTCWRAYITGGTYTIPTITLPKTSRAELAPSKCPHCGGVL